MCINSPHFLSGEKQFRDDSSNFTGEKTKPAQNVINLFAFFNFQFATNPSSFPYTHRPGHPSASDVRIRPGEGLWGKTQPQSWASGTLWCGGALVRRTGILAALL